MRLPCVCTALVGIYWGALVTAVVFVLWFRLMPTTCMSGGLVCSAIAMTILLNTMGILLAAVIRLVVSLSA